VAPSTSVLRMISGHLVRAFLGSASVEATSGSARGGIFDGREGLGRVKKSLSPEKPASRRHAPSIARHEPVLVAGDAGQKKGWRRRCFLEGGPDSARRLRLLPFARGRRHWRAHPEARQRFPKVLDELLGLKNVRVLPQACRGRKGFHFVQLKF